MKVPSFLKRVGSLFSKPARQDEEPPVNTVSLIIEGVEVVTAEAAPTGSVKFCAPGHPWNPTDENLLICNLETFVSLAVSPDSQRRVGLMVIDALRALRVKERSAVRRERRRTKAAGRAL